MRVSTADQSLDLQRDGLEEFAKRAGLEITHWFEDHAVSGRREARPALNDLMRVARGREVKCVLVWKFDRFARSTSHLLRALEEFNFLGIRFVSVRNDLDTDSPYGKAFFTMASLMAELESDLISERVKAGMEAARKRGVKLGRPRTGAHLQARIEQLALETNHSISEITRLLGGRVGRSTVGAIVKRVRSTN